MIHLSDAPWTTMAFFVIKNKTKQNNSNMEIENAKK